MADSTLGIMTFFKWAFALASFSKDPGFTKFLHHGTETRSRSKDLQAKRFEFLWLLLLLCFQNKTGQVHTHRAALPRF